MPSALTPTTNGAIYTKQDGEQLILEIPNFDNLGINPNAPSYHEYDEVHQAGSSNVHSNNYISNSDIIWRNLLEEPAPTFGLATGDIPVTSGSVTTIPGLGSVTTYVYPEDNIVVNVTIQGQHALYPGIVVRELYQDSDSNYDIRTTGIGNGINPFNVNEALADYVWGNNVERIQRESILEDHGSLPAQFATVDNLRIYNSSDFSQALTSLGYAQDITERFGTQGWGALGEGNAHYDDVTYSFGGSNFTIFGGSQNITLPSVPRPDSVIWINNSSTSDFQVNPQLNLYFDGWASGLRNFKSPIAIDMDGDGIETTHIYDDGEVYFDIDGDGFAERVGWIAPDDTLIAMDHNGNGTIDDITELYGDDVMPAFQKLELHDSNGGSERI